jgi:hypothetical protein
MTEELGLSKAEAMTMAPERKVWKVLFVDEEEGIRKVMAISLADAGYQVLNASDGETALSLCRTDSNAMFRRAVSRSSFPGRCSLRLGPVTTRSMPCPLAPACCFAPFLRVKMAPKEVSSRCGFRRPGILVGRSTLQQGFRLPFRTQDKENQKEAWHHPFTQPCQRALPRTLLSLFPMF